MIGRLEEELEDVRRLAGEASIESLRDGSWLVSALRATVDDYTAAVDRTSLVALHPGLDRDALADARIRDAQWRAALAGGTSAGVYASVVLATITTGTFVAVALPAAITAFAVDLYYQARLQICLAWDLSLVYEHPLDPTDDGDLWTLTRVAFGADDASSASAMAGPAVPLASRFGSRAITTGARLATGVSAIGRTLALRTVGKLALPAVGVPLCAGVNHMTTGAVGRAARRIFRDRATGRALAAELREAEALVTAAVLLVLHADRRLAGAELVLMSELTPDLSEVQALLALDTDALIERIRTAPAPLRRAAIEAARAAAELDEVIDPAEARILDQFGDLGD